MSKRAEEAAQEAYQEKMYYEGYEYAEKKYALTWEDMQIIGGLIDDVLAETYTGGKTAQMISVLPEDKEIYGEVLRRFNEYREKQK